MTSTKTLSNISKDFRVLARPQNINSDMFYIKTSYVESYWEQNIIKILDPFSMYYILCSQIVFPEHLEDHTFKLIEHVLKQLKKREISLNQDIGYFSTMHTVHLYYQECDRNIVMGFANEYLSRINGPDINFNLEASWTALT